MKHILVISDPPVAPGFLPRLRYLCDFLVRQGYGVTLLTEEQQPLAFEHNYPVLTIPMYSGTTLDWAVKTAWTLLTDWHNRAFARKALQTSDIKHQTYDAVLCTTFSDFPLGAALHIARRLRVPLLCDVRDLEEQVDNSCYQYHHRQWWAMPFRRIYRAVHIRRRNRVLRAAQSVTTVSPWHAQFIRTLNPNVRVIYNGYDPKQFYPDNSPTDAFRITYIGSLFEWQQPALEKVKQAIEELNQSSNLPYGFSRSFEALPRLEIDLHTPQHDPVSHDELGNTIRKAGIMLVLTSTQTHGMLTTKFYEALGCRKPVLCVPSDRGALAELIRYTNAGIATDDIEQIKQFIREKYNEWQTAGYTLQPVEHYQEFSRETQSAAFLTMLP